MWYLTINKIQAEFENKGFALIYPRVMVPERCDWISLKFIWHMTSNKTQVKFRKGGYMPIWTGVSDVLVLFIFSLMTDWTRAGSKLCYR